MNHLDTVIWGDVPMRWQDVAKVAKSGAGLQLSQNAWERIDNARAVVNLIVNERKTAYGINTGLGALCNVILDPQQLSQLSRNTLMSHACGVGPVLTDVQARAIICAAIANYSHGKSGISADVVRGLLALLNHHITPQIPSQGSVGYLTHMAHVGLALIGIGDASYKGNIVAAADALKMEGLNTISLGAKEGLSLVNGTPCMTGLSCLALEEAQRLLDWADITGAMSFEALCGQLDAFDPEILALKGSAGVQWVGERLNNLLADSDILASGKGIRTQDALSLRSIPQIHGACREQFTHAARQIETELNAATDNPLILGSPEKWRVVSQANPHGESVAMAADLLAIALAEIGSVAERRLDRLVNPLVSGLPPFLVDKPGVNSGMMIAQYVAASICGENRQLAQPAVLDNYVTSGQQEDHLSMGTSSALKLLKLTENVCQILAIEYLLAAQALDFHDVARAGKGTAKAHALLRLQVDTWTEDRWLAPEISKAAAVIRSQRL